MRGKKSQITKQKRWDLCKHKDLTTAEGCVNCATLEGGRTEVVISYRQNRQHHIRGIPFPSPPPPKRKRKKALPISQKPSRQNTPIVARQRPMCRRPLSKAPARHKCFIQRITRQTFTTRQEARYPTSRLARRAWRR
jgi:hypothetical protein